MSHFVIKLSHFVTPVPVQSSLGDRMQDFAVHAGNKYLPKVKNPFGFNWPDEKIHTFNKKNHAIINGGKIGEQG